MKTTIFFLAWLALSACSPPATPWERYGGGQCTDVYLAHEVNDRGPYCPHPHHFPIDEYVTAPTKGRPARVVACACVNW